MKGRVILIDEPKERASQAALLIDGRVEDLLLDPLKGDRAPAPGEIYWAKVDRLVPKMGGAFLRLTPEQMGFLREAKGLKEGRGALVQVTSYSEPGKATPVSTRVLYKGRLVIHTPDAPGINVSRQIKDANERQRLSSIVDDFVRERLEEADRPVPTHAEIEQLRAEMLREGHDPAPPEVILQTKERHVLMLRHVFGSGGFIIRTSAVGAEPDELRLEIEWVTAARCSAEPLTQEPPPLASPAGQIRHAARDALREWTAPIPQAIIAGSQAYRFYSHTNEALGPINLWGNHRLHSVLARHDGPDLFDAYGVRDEIERLQSPRVDLPSGGWMAVEATRAMVTVDVNTAAEFSAGAALTANLEAARELPRQLRLRGLGGQVIVDFAPVKKTDRRRLEDALKTSFRRDPVETTLAGWTPLGNFELQRKRERRPLADLLA